MKQTVFVCDLCNSDSQDRLRGYNPNTGALVGRYAADVHVCQTCVDAIWQARDVQRMTPASDGWLELVPGEYWAKGEARIMRRPGAGRFGFHVFLPTGSRSLDSLGAAKEFAGSSQCA